MKLTKIYIIGTCLRDLAFVSDVDVNFVNFPSSRCSMMGEFLFFTFFRNGISPNSELFFLISSSTSFKLSLGDSLTALAFFKSPTLFRNKRFALNLIP